MKQWNNEKKKDTKREKQQKKKRKIGADTFLCIAFANFAKGCRASDDDWSSQRDEKLEDYL